MHTCMGCMSELGAEGLDLAVLALEHAGELAAAALGLERREALRALEQVGHLKARDGGKGEGKGRWEG